MELTPSSLARMIDYAYLKMDCTHDGLVAACNTARLYGFNAITVAPYWLSLAKGLLAGSGVKASTVVAFPLGYTTTEVKVAEAVAACRNGAQQLHVVMNISALKSGQLEFVESELAQVREAIAEWAPQFVVIIEAPILTSDEMRVACKVAERAGADFVKNCTGFGAIGARAEDIATMRAALSQRVGVKASGGIASLDYALAVIEAGASLIGASAAPKIVDELRARGRVTVKPKTGSA